MAKSLGASLRKGVSDYQAAVVSAMVTVYGETLGSGTLWEAH